MEYSMVGKDLLDNLTNGSEISLFQILIVLSLACVAGVYIFFVYKNFSRSEFYSKDLNISIAGITVIVAAIMIAMQSNLIVSLGMVGALSIVRFRTAIKNPMDLLYLFWAISSGIVCGVGLYELLVVLCVMMTFLLFILGKIPNSKAPLLLIIRAESEVNVETISKLIKEHSLYFRQKSIIIRNKDKEIIYELKSRSYNSLLDLLREVEGVHSINCLEHDGELRV